jgi:hypothetical protein
MCIYVHKYYFEGTAEGKGSPLKTPISQRSGFAGKKSMRAEVIFCIDIYYIYTYIYMYCLFYCHICLFISPILYYTLLCTDEYAPYPPYLHHNLTCSFPLIHQAELDLLPSIPTPQPYMFLSSHSSSRIRPPTLHTYTIT